MQLYWCWNVQRAQQLRTHSHWLCTLQDANTMNECRWCMALCNFIILYRGISSSAVITVNNKIKELWLAWSVVCVFLALRWWFQAVSAIFSLSLCPFFNPFQDRFFKPDDAKAQDEAIRAMENCIEDLRNWLIEGRLLVNDDKTEFLVIGTRQQLNKSVSTSCWWWYDWSFC